MLRQALSATALAVLASRASGQEVPTAKPDDPAATMPTQGESGLPSSPECEGAVANDVSDVANILHALPDMNLSQADQAQALAELASILDRVIRICAPIDYSLPPTP